LAAVAKILAISPLESITATLGSVEKVKKKKNQLTNQISWFQNTSVITVRSSQEMNPNANQSL